MNYAKEIAARLYVEYKRHIIVHICEPDPSYLLEESSRVARKIERELNPYSPTGGIKMMSLHSFESAYYQKISIDVSKIQNEIRKELCEQLYTHREISEREYHELCQLCQTKS